MTPPTLTAEKLTPAGVAISCGVVKSPPTDPIPSSPAMLMPQQYPVPSVSAAHDAFCPTSTVTKCTPGAATNVGVELASVVPSPRVPAPQQ